jgi:hypothetical protein
LIGEKRQKVKNLFDLELSYGVEVAFSAFWGKLAEQPGFG